MTMKLAIASNLPALNMIFVFCRVARREITQSNPPPPARKASQKAQRYQFFSDPKAEAPRVWAQAETPPSVKILNAHWDLWESLGLI